MSDIQILEPDHILNLIYTIRGAQVMLDSDLANLYGVETRILNQAVNRNNDRFPEEFRFQLTKKEFGLIKLQPPTSSNRVLMSQIVISKEKRGGRQKSPYVFTEQGVAMLSSVLRSDTAVKVSILIMNTFVNMRKFIGTHAQLFERMDRVELKQLEQDGKFDKVFDAIEQREITPKTGHYL